MEIINTHSLSVDSMNKVLNAGGFVCPSVAIRPADWVPGDEEVPYGDIIAVFRDETVDPANDPSCVLHEVDGYTNTVTDPSYVINRQASLAELVMATNGTPTWDEDWFGEGLCRAAAGLKFRSLDAAMAFAEEHDLFAKTDEEAAARDEKLDDEYWEAVDVVKNDPANRSRNGVWLSDLDGRQLFTPKNEEKSVLAAVKAMERMDANAKLTAKQKGAMREAAWQRGGCVLPAKALREIQKYVEDVRTLPGICYMEAKLHYAVPLDEPVAVMLPDERMDRPEWQKLKERLEDAGMTVETYSLSSNEPLAEQMADKGISVPAEGEYR